MRVDKADRPEDGDLADVTGEKIVSAVLVMRWVWRELSKEASLSGLAWLGMLVPAEEGLAPTITRVWPSFRADKEE